MIGSGFDVTELITNAADELRERSTARWKRGSRTGPQEAETRARQLRQLTAELAKAEQRGRQQVATALHENVQQGLAACRMQLDALSRKAAILPEVGQEVRSIAGMLGELTEMTRSLSHELNPAVLQGQGLAAALGWLAEQMRKQHRLAVKVRITGEVIPLAEELGLFLYHAARELLTNVI